MKTHAEHVMTLAEIAENHQRLISECEMKIADYTISEIERAHWHATQMAAQDFWNTLTYFVQREAN